VCWRGYPVLRFTALPSSEAESPQIVEVLDGFFLVPLEREGRGRARR